MSRRDQIKMTDAEALAFLEQSKTVTVASQGRDGWPHLMPLWYVVRDGELWGWTYAASQKVRNLERDPRCTLLVEAGTEYAELHGVMLRCEVELVRDLDTVTGIGMALAAKYSGATTAGARGQMGIRTRPPGPAPSLGDMRATFEKQAAKRVGLHFVERGPRATWDHRKLAAGVY